MWKKLLVPHDFSGCAAAALCTATELARVHGSEIALVHVSELPANLPAETLVTPAGASGPIRVDLYTQRGAREQLEGFAATVRREGIAVRTYATVGDVADQILALAGELRADALVVGTHGRRGLSHLLLGSIAEKLVRRATVPVVTVRMPALEAALTPEERAAEDELAG